MTYTPNKAFKKIDKLTREGFPLRLAVYAVSSELDISSEHLRMAYDKRNQRIDFLSDSLLALGMAVFSFPPFSFTLSQRLNHAE